MKTTTKKTLLSLLALTLAAAPEQARAYANTFANATVITDSNQSNGTVSILNFDSEVGEPPHSPSGDGAKKTAWWRWTAPSNGFCTVDTLNGENGDNVNDTVVAVYTGATVGALTRVVRNDDHQSSLNKASRYYSSTTFYAIQGMTYHIAVDGFVPEVVTASNYRVTLRLRHLAAAPESRLGTFASSSDPGINGSIQLTKTTAHSFTAKLVLAGKSYPFKGVFGLDGYYMVSIERKAPAGSAPLPPLTLMLDGAQNGLFGVAYGTGYFETKFCEVQRFTKMQPSLMQGLFSASISGAGTLSFKVSNLGVVSGAAMMFDGTKATFGSVLCKNQPTSCLVPTYTALHANAGCFYSYLKITENGMTDGVQHTNAFYQRPAKPGALFYPAGISTSPSIVGSTYIPPATGARALGFLNGSMGAGKLSIGKQGVEIDPGITESLTLGTNNAIKFTSPLMRKPVLTLNKANGLVTGSIYDQAGKKRTMTGVLYLDGMTPKIKGYLTGTTSCPTFEVIP